MRVMANRQGASEDVVGRKSAVRVVLQRVYVAISRQRSSRDSIVEPLLLPKVLTKGRRERRPSIRITPILRQ
jgi:hypothetical protein